LLSGIGWYQRRADFAGGGALVPLPGFGHVLAEGVKKAIDEHGLPGIITGGFTAMAGGVTVAVVFGYIAALLSKPSGNVP
jgi:stage V sporulation protein AE